MKVAVICNSDSLGFPAIGHLINKGCLAGTAILARNMSTLFAPLIAAGVPQANILLLSKDNWQVPMENWLREISPAMVWVFGFPWRIPETILNIPPGGFLNFHFGNVPQYKGADPIFWQLRNGEEKAVLVVHKMTANIDEGPVVLQLEIPIVKGENYGLFCRRSGYLAAELVDKLINDYLNNHLAENKQEPGVAPYLKKPEAQTLTINWEDQSAEDIECLVNAANPKYDGASTFLGSTEMRILEATPAEINTENGFKAAPGTVVYADALYGLIVACKQDKFLKINIVHTAEGYFSGSKLFSMGVKAGEKFNNLN